MDNIDTESKRFNHDRKQQEYITELELLKAQYAGMGHVLVEASDRIAALERDLAAERERGDRLAEAQQDAAELYSVLDAVQRKRQGAYFRIDSKLGQWIKQTLTKHRAVYSKLEPKPDRTALAAHRQARP